MKMLHHDQFHLTSNQMKDDSTTVQVNDIQFDVLGIFETIISHPYVFLAVVLIGYIFFISRKDGLLGCILDYRIKSKMIDAQQLNDIRALTELAENRPKIAGQGGRPAVPLLEGGSNA